MAAVAGSVAEEMVEAMCAAAPLARLFAKHAPERMVWGSDWPFVRLDMRVDYGPTRAVFDRWVPDAKARQKILWDTPARLFGFK